jgi:hypothetical protein
MSRVRRDQEPRIGRSCRKNDGPLGGAKRAAGAAATASGDAPPQRRQSLLSAFDYQWLELGGYVGCLDAGPHFKAAPGDLPGLIRSDQNPLSATPAFGLE